MKKSFLAVTALAAVLAFSASTAGAQTLFFADDFSIKAHGRGEQRVTTVRRVHHAIVSALPSELKQPFPQCRIEPRRDRQRRITLKQ